MVSKIISKNKKYFKFFTIVSLILVGIVIFLFNAFDVIAEEKYGVVKVSLLNQDPYPALPNDYVDLVFKIENTGRADVHNFLIELLPQYPFSLDSDVDAVKDLGTLSFLQYGSKAVFVKYRVRVDKNAIDGNNEIKIRYVYNTDGKWDNYITKEFNVTIEDTKTDFDVAIQDFSYKTNTLSLAISNIGNKDANSVTVSLPEQSSIEILGSDKNIVGGIEANDYTIATFKIVPKQDGALVVRIAYTDSIGIRREVEKAVIFKASVYDQKTTTKTTNATDYRALIYIVIGILGIVIIFIVLGVLRKRRKKQAS